MPEEQQVRGDDWNRAVNALLTELAWTQLGDSNVDVEVSRSGKSIQAGLDSIFYYNDVLEESLPRLFLIEAKYYAWQGATTAEIQKWIDNCLVKVVEVKKSSDFRAKFAPPDRTSYKDVLLILWHHDEFDLDRFQKRLAKIEIPQKTKPINVFVISNNKILEIAAVIEVLKRLAGQEGYQDVEFKLPFRDSNEVVHGKLLPIEYFLSKFIFAKAVKRVNISGVDAPKQVNIVFYFGDLDTRSLEFLRSACNKIQITGEEVLLYCSQDLKENRAPVENFARTHEKYEFRQLVVGNQLPGWLTYGN